MKITIIGASGFVGRATVDTALKDGHQVIAVSRHGDFPAHKDLTVIHHDINDWQALVPQLTGTDLIISTFNAGWKNPNLYHDFLAGAHAINQLANKLDQRIIIVGGASSLYDRKTGHQLYQDANKEFHAMVRGAYDLYQDVKHDLSFKWTFVSPAVDLNDSAPSDDYNVGGDYVLYDHRGNSRISVYDLADLLINVAPNAQLLHRRITLAEK